MTEVLFYHLTHDRLENALPGLLERCLERDWNVVVQCGSEELCSKLDDHLWTYRDESFLPHAAETKEPGNAENHPVWLTTTINNPNKAEIRFLVGGAVHGGAKDYQRVIYMFDGDDEDAVADARERWKIEKKDGFDLTYWMQDENGRWSKKA